jgi:hypothetical protein
MMRSLRAGVPTLMTLALFQCAPEAAPPPSPQLADVEARLRVACPDLPDIPKGNGDPRIRKDYDAETRALYAGCAAKNKGLLAYIDTVRK